MFWKGEWERFGGINMDKTFSGYLNRGVFDGGAENPLLISIRFNLKILLKPCSS